MPPCQNGMFGTSSKPMPTTCCFSCARYILCTEVLDDRSSGLHQNASQNHDRADGPRCVHRTMAAAITNKRGMN
jgi:hypothetical protein